MVNLTRRAFLWALGAIGCGTSAAPQVQSRGRMAKVIQIICDDLGYGDLACYGHAFAVTPNIDSLATNGRKFNQFHVASPVCSPSRTGFMLGIYPQFVHCHNADVPEISRRYYLPEGANTIAKRLKTFDAVGGGPFIHTAHFGKWHLGEPPVAQLPTSFGFDYFFGTLGGRPSSSWLTFARYNDPQMVEITPSAVGSMSTRTGWADQISTDALIAWLDTDRGNGKPKDGNFYVQLWTYFPHEPLTLDLPTEILDLYAGKTNAEKAYFGSITMGDNAVGDLLAALDALGILEDTIIVFTSDNGPEVGGLSAGSAGPLKGNKTTLWQGGVQIPMLAQGPGFTAATEDNEPRGALDWVPTVLDIFGATGDAALTGASMLDTGLGERSFFWEYHKTQRGTTSPGNAIRKGDWKLLSTATPQLYDLSTDPGEATNVAATQTAKRDELDADLTAWLATLPTEVTTGSGVSAPANEAAANMIAAEPLANGTRYCRPGSAGDMTTLVTDVNTLLGLPRSVVCPHGAANVTESTYGTATFTHPTLGSNSIKYGTWLELALNDSTNRARCNGTQLANLDDRIRNGFVPPAA